MDFDIPKSPRLPERHPVCQPNRNCTSALDVVRKKSDHNWTLEEPTTPYELIVAILHLSLPPVYVDDHEGWSPDPCPTYSVALHSLRSVCKWWRDVVDGTPFFWKVICSALPIEVNSTILLKSGQRHLVIHGLFHGPPQHEFMELANRHRHRWGTAAFQIPAAYAESAASYLTAPAPQLQSLVLSSKPLEPPLNVYHLLGGQTHNIRHLKIYESQIEWLPNAFTGLRSLTLAQISQVLPTQYVLDILASSPSLEILALSSIVFDPSSIDARSPPSYFPLLRSLRLGAIGAMAVDSILRSLAVEPSVVASIHIDLPLQEPNFDVARFVKETLPAFSLVLNRLNASCGGSDLKFRRFGQSCRWAARNDAGHSFSFSLPQISLSTYLPWIEQAVGVGVPGGVVRLHFVRFPPTVTSVLPVLRPSRIITGMVLNPAVDTWCLDPLFEALSGLETIDGSHTTADTIPSFPALRTIRSTNWIWSLDRIEQALQRRFAKRASMGLNIPDLLVELSYPDDFWTCSSEGMLSFDTLQRIRAIDGVKDVRVRCSSAIEGILAVVWCEAASQNGRTQYRAKLQPWRDDLAKRTVLEFPF
ncbi:hypothetical protein FRC05_005746 [Tulasnella sp. 425]|nr:hypothetical protein FRC05_005746 [Tulasnella sp. 425]